ncbi:enoyl CoA hydratase domain-containing protein 1 [Linnemannia schmuckeri]|uniref:Enoyl CoA hydratase domain-containing protein 1 n=1 Tax=Linnemannia schmuckeri TaxID=64567 RepID=A0A9P5S5Q5_9FUNG|nr:enoyl CoA hydratase domain-containing protein 1 [Linnemannia schmuckeri]
MLRTFALAHRLPTTSASITTTTSWKTPIPTLSFLTTSLLPTPSTHHQQQHRNYACQINHPTKIGQLRAKLRTFGQGHIELDISHSPGLALLTLTNPDKHNALTGKMMAELADCVDLLETVTDPKRREKEVREMEEDVRELLKDSGLVLKKGGVAVQKLDLDALKDGLVGVIVTGSQHKSYCAGLDLSAAKTTLLTPQAGSEMSALMVSTLTRFMRLPLISIAAIEKAAIGGGAEMTTFCDHRCITDQAKIQFVQTQMGVVTGWGGASRLLNLVSRSQALRLLGSAEPIRGGEEALKLGFAQAVSPVGKAVEGASEYMQQYVWEKAPAAGQDDDVGARRCVEAVRAMKRIVSFGLDYERIERVSELEKDLFKGLWGGPDNLARVETASAPKKKK